MDRLRNTLVFGDGRFSGSRKEEERVEVSETLDPQGDVFGLRQRGSRRASGSRAARTVQLEQLEQLLRWRAVDRGGLRFLLLYLAAVGSGLFCHSQTPPPGRCLSYPQKLETRLHRTSFSLVSCRRLHPVCCAGFENPSLSSRIQPLS